jgi:predicted MFS family arabinose efflux permease
MGIGSMTLSPLARWLITAYDWRVAMFELGMLSWLLIIPAALLLRKTPVLSNLIGADGVTDREDREFTVARALCTPLFAASSLTYFACCAPHSGPIFHMVSHAIDCGVPAMAAATVFGTAGLASLSGRVTGGLAADRIGAKRMIIAGLALQALSVSLYLFTRQLTSFYALAVMFGFSYGAVMPLYAILVRADYGNHVRRGQHGLDPGYGARPVDGGRVYDLYGSYFWLYIGSGGVGLGAVAVALTFRPPSALSLALPPPSLQQA